MRIDVRQTTAWGLRHVVYVAIMLLVYMAVYLDAMGGDVPGIPRGPDGQPVAESAEVRIQRLSQLGKFNDGGLLETMELCMLISVVAACAWMAWQHPEVRTLSLIMSGWVLLAIIREEDHVFDRIGWLPWFVPAFLVLGIMLLYAFRRREELVPGFVHMVNTSGWGFFISGVLVSMVFARLMGQKQLWFYLIHDPRLARNIKNMAEEGFETAGYALFLCGVIEGCCFLHKRKLDEADAYSDLLKLKSGDTGET